MPTEKTEAIKKKPVQAKSLPKASNSAQSARPAAGYSRAARAPVARSGR